jgi:plasmid replication initiation protein
MYDRLFNETLSPVLERKARKLLADKDFVNGTNTYRRQEVNRIIKETRSAVNEAMPLLSDNHRMNKQRYDTINYSGNSEQYKNAKKTFHKIRLERMRDEGATEEELRSVKVKDPLTMTESELNQFKAILSLYKETAKGE